MKFLKFPFTAPLQSWGEDARWDNRSTAAMPTKSGIIGYLGCCMGFSRGDSRLNKLNYDLRIAVRADRPGQILTDFQTVQGTDGTFLNAEGKTRTGGGTIITPKQYLQDAWFTVFLEGEEAVLSNCFNAMIHPKWAPFLGRKNCVPSVPVCPEWVEADSLEDAVRLFSEKDPVRGGKSITVEMDTGTEQEELSLERVYSRRDNLIHPEKNEYSSRRVKSFVVSGGEPS